MFDGSCVRWYSLPNTFTVIIDPVHNNFDTSHLEMLIIPVFLSGTCEQDKLQLYYMPTIIKILSVITTQSVRKFVDQEVKRKIGFGLNTR